MTNEQILEFNRTIIDEFRANDGIMLEADGAERDRVFSVMTTQLPRFADYQDQVSRQIPLFRLTRS